MENPILALKRFGAGVIAVQKLTPPIKVELLDAGMSPIFEMEASKVEQGLVLFSKERAAGATLAQPHPWSVRFTAEGEQPFVMDFPFPQG